MPIFPATLHLGIDTGGTFTDGVLLDPATRQVVRSAKVLTTHQDLKACIALILDQLLPDQHAAISLVSLSTTLATNAIAEGKRKPVALLLLGYDRQLVYRFNFHKQFGTSHFFFIEGRHDLNGAEQVPLDEEEIARAAEGVENEVDAFAVASYAGPVNPQHEERAAEILSARSSLPVIQAHHLSSELDSIRRATTASLNASLLTNIQEFVEAVHLMLAQKGVRCPVMIVRGDGSLVKAGYARRRPVEIIHSGPATSGLGGQFLARTGAALVVDMGGTTTDLIVVDQGRIQALQDAATIGPYRTCVRTVRARSFGLGGDSQIQFDRYRALKICPRRVLPLSRLCSEFPAVEKDLGDTLLTKDRLNHWDNLEYWILRREPRHAVHNERTLKALDLLRAGPQRMRRLLREVGARSPVLIDRDELLNQGVIERAGLTPTDLLHVSGEYAPWNAEIARLAAAEVARLWNEDALAFTRRVKNEMTRRVVAEVVQYLSNRTLSEETLSFASRNLDRWLFEESLSDSDPYLGCRIQLKIPLVGIGAPAGVFLPPVARALGTEFVLPDHYEVANAVGTVVGSVSARREGSVFPCVEGHLLTGSFARVADRQEKFADYPQALAFAREALTRQVAAEVLEAGAAPDLVECEVKELSDGMARLLAWAVGTPGADGAQSI